MTGTPDGNALIVVAWAVADHSCGWLCAVNIVFHIIPAHCASSCLTLRFLGLAYSPDVGHSYTPSPDAP